MLSFFSRVSTSPLQQSCQRFIVGRPSSKCPSNLSTAASAAYHCIWASGSCFPMGAAPRSHSYSSFTLFHSKLTPNYQVGHGKRKFHTSVSFLLQLSKDENSKPDPSHNNSPPQSASHSKMQPPSKHTASSHSSSIHISSQESTQIRTKITSFKQSSSSQESNFFSSSRAMKRLHDSQRKEYFEKIIRSSSNLLSRTGSTASRLYKFSQRSVLKRQGGTSQLVRRLLDRVQVPGNRRHSYEKELAKTVEHTVTTQHNDIIMFHRGDLLFKDLWARMDEAKECILFETYTLGPDFTGNTTMDKLIAARKRGVEVVLVVDAFGSFELKSCDLLKLANAGVVVRKFNPRLRFSPRYMMTRNHRKQCIIDWKYSYVGGMNVEDKYSHLVPSKKLFRDTHSRITGPFVKQVIISFLESFEYALHGYVRRTGQTKQEVHEENLRIFQLLRFGVSHRKFETFDYDPTRLVPLADLDKKLEINSLPANVYGSTDVDICFTSSHPRAGRRILQTCLVNHLDAAQESIRICTPYFFPSRPLKRALYRAAARGVKVTILTCQKSDVPLMKYAANHLYQNLVIRHGINIYEYKESILHAKYLIIDGWITSGGSYNFDEVSYFSNLEMFLAVYSREIGEKTTQQFEEDLSKSHQITHKWIQDQPVILLRLYALAATFLRCASAIFRK